MKGRVKGIPSFFSDGLKFYRNALLRSYGRVVKFPRTGKRGRPRSPALVPDEKLRYAQMIKRRRNGHLVEGERKQIFREEDRDITTSMVERCNLTVR